MVDETKLRIIPTQGLVSIQNLADFLGTGASALQQRLTDNEIPTLALSDRFTHRFVSLADLVDRVGKKPHELKEMPKNG